MVKDKVVKVTKRDGTTEDYNFEKIKIAITKSADRVNYKFTKKDLNKIKSFVDLEIDDLKECNIDFIHGVVENVLMYVNKNVAQSYMNYRNYKTEDLKLFQDVAEDFLEAIDGESDNENSNTNLRHNATKRTEGAKRFSKELYKKLYVNADEKEAMKKGYIYENDQSDKIIRGYNCALSRVGEILKGGFELEGYEYVEPKDIDVAVGQMSDIIREISGQHYGGLTVPQVDKILAKYHKMNYELMVKEAIEDYGLDMTKEDNIKLIKRKNYRKLCQNLQGLEMSIQTLGSSRGSYPFVTFTFGDVDDEWEADIGKAILEVRLKGHGSKVKKRCIFPKLVFLHDDELHGENKEYEWLYDLAIECSSKSMYPDYIDSKFYKHEGKWISPMG